MLYVQVRRVAMDRSDFVDKISEQTSPSINVDGKIKNSPRGIAPFRIIDLINEKKTRRMTLILYI